MTFTRQKILVIKPLESHTNRTTWSGWRLSLK